MEKKTGSCDSSEGIFPCAKHCGGTHKFTQLLAPKKLNFQCLMVQKLVKSLNALPK